MIKSSFQVKKIPLIGPVLSRLYKKAMNQPIFTTSGEYWEKRYFAGGNSGTGSYNNLAEYKAEIINKFLEEKKIDTVMEFGCGDGNQLKYFNCKSYIGFDVSSSIIKKCQELYQADDTKKFKLIDSYDNEKADLVLSLDVIYHLVEDEVFSEYMGKVFSSSKKYVIIYSSNENEHENNNKYPHVKHRKFTDWISVHAPDFQLEAHLINPHSYRSDVPNSTYADFYIFKKVV